MKYPVLQNGEWTAPIHRGYRLVCCDCGLTHVLDFRKVEKQIQFRAMRDERATSQIRRWMRKRGELHG